MIKINPTNNFLEKAHNLVHTIVMAIYPKSMNQ